MGNRKPDPSQDRIIEAGAGARLLVEAGPGFGKTDVACARVAHLIGKGVEPGHILLLSFTRTAVREMRARIRQLLEAGVEAYDVEIRTLDSFSWRLRVGLSEKSKRLKRFGYEESIAELVKMLAKPDEQMNEYLSRFEHVFVDEAQDLIGERAVLVTRLLNALPASCGWTVFLDPAQAIYGWADDGGGGASGQSFLDLLGKLSGKPGKAELSVLHRTGDQALRKLAIATRELVLGRKPRGKSRVEVVRGRIEELVRVTEDSTVELVRSLGASDSTLLLYRTRFEALQCSGELASAGIPHRLRFGALPPAVAPWIASVANRATSQTLDREGFDAIWSTVEGSRGARGWDVEGAWRTLRRLGAKGRSQVSLPDVADRLASASLPDELSIKEVGASGPIVGTIHGSKGREADTVILVLPQERDDADDDEEARVLYVGLTRARQQIRVVKGSYMGWRVESGRAWRRSSKGNVQMEIGRTGDVDVLACVNSPVSKSAQLQTLLESHDGAFRTVTCLAQREYEWKRLLYVDDARGNPQCIGGLDVAKNSPLYRDLWNIGGSAWGAGAPPGNCIKHMRWVDVTTVAVRSDWPLLDDVPQPYRKTRLWLAPVLAGLGVMFQRHGRASNG